MRLGGGVRSRCFAALSPRFMSPRSALLPSIGGAALSALELAPGCAESRRRDGDAQRSMEFQITQFSDTASYNRALSQCRRAQSHAAERGSSSAVSMYERIVEAWRWSRPASWSAGDPDPDDPDPRAPSRAEPRPERAGHGAFEALGAGAALPPHFPHFPPPLTEALARHLEGAPVG